jgi:hypothetical protein
MSEARTRCRRCRAKLEAPTENPLNAFCCKGCVRLHYQAKCVICEGRKSGRGLACNHPKCRSELAAKKRYETMGRLLPTSRKKLGSVTPIKQALSEASEGRRTHRIVAGSLTPVQLRLATIGAAFGNCPLDLDRKLNRRHWLEAERAEIEAGGNFGDAEWRAAVSSDGVRCFIAKPEKAHG